MKTVYADGREITDQPLDIRSSTSGINVIFTDRVTALSGTVTGRSQPAPAGLTVIAFAADDARWHPSSRFIQAARTDKGGAYRLNALPPGDYLVAVVDDVEQGEWFDPAFLARLKDAAVKVRLDEGEKKTQDLRTSGSESPGAPLS